MEAPKLVTIADLVQMLNVNLDMNTRLQSDPEVDLKPLSHAQIELPRIVESVDPVKFFTYDIINGWCLVETRLAHATTPFKTYREWLVRWRHCVEKLSKDSYVIYRLYDRVPVDGRRYIPLESLGFNSTLLTCETDATVAGIELLRPASEPVKVSYRFDEVKIVCPPFLRPLMSATQTHIYGGSTDIVEWLAKFTVGKHLRSDFPVHFESTDQNIILVRSAHARSLTRFMSVLPRLNAISITYCSTFVIPSVEFASIDVAALARDIRLSQNRAEALSPVLYMNVRDTNLSDFKKIIMAMCMPSQIMVRIRNDTESNEALRGFSALCCKMLFSTSDNCRNLTRDSEELINTYIIDLLIYLGITVDMSFTLVHNTTISPTAVNAWRQVIGDPNVPGDGWINTESTGLFVIPDPLYDGITHLPCYAGITTYTPLDSCSSNSYINDPVILVRIRNALTSLRYKKLTNSNVVEQMISIIHKLHLNYKVSLSMLNEHIRRTGETGFRIPFSRISEVEATDLGLPEEGKEIRQVMTIDLVSVLMFFRQMPSEFFPSDLLIHQPRIESAVSSELQRLFSLISLTRARVQRDDRCDEIGKSPLISLVVDNSLSNQFARQIMKTALSNDFSRMLDLDRIDALVPEFDDFEANGYFHSAKAVMRYPEHFGFTRNVVQQLSSVELIDNLKYNQRRKMGIVSSNTTNIPRNTIVPLSYRAMLKYLNSSSLLHKIKQSDGKITLPLWMEYKEVVGTEWPAESYPYMIKMDNSIPSALKPETIEFGEFVRFHLVSRNKVNFSPDSCLMGCPDRRFWYSGTNNLITPFKAEELALDFDFTVRIPARFMKVESVYSVISSGEKTT